MSHVCAKPACTQSVQVWLDFAPGSRQVVEQRSRTEVSVGLCDDHAQRFTVPVGWSIERLPQHETDDRAATDRTNRTSSRERPWFLALSDSVPDEPSSSEAADPEQRDASPDDQESADVELSAGSLLHRAFHGPDRSTDRDRAVREQLDELESRRAAKGPREAHDHGMAELPFPPFEPEHRVAVS